MLAKTGLRTNELVLVDSGLADYSPHDSLSTKVAVLDGECRLAAIKPMPKLSPPSAESVHPVSQVDDDWRSGSRTRRRGFAKLSRLLLLIVPSAVVFLASGGCGTTKGYEATEQLLLSEAVDDSIAQIDFRPMSGYRVFLDTQYIKNVKSLGFVNSDYVISSMRQQIVGAGCLLQDKLEEADLVIEARCGTLGADSFQVTYGIPANSFLTTAAQAIPGAPPVPIIPDLSVARREAREGASKVAAFAYDRLTRQPVWQSGMSKASTTSRDTWVLGIGPIQTGSIRRGTRWIGSGLEFGGRQTTDSSPRNLYERPPVNYEAEVRFEEGQPILGPRLMTPQLLESEPTEGETLVPDKDVGQTETLPAPQPGEPQTPAEPAPTP